KIYGDSAERILAATKAVNEMKNEELNQVQILIDITTNNSNANSFIRLVHPEQQVRVLEEKTMESIRLGLPISIDNSGQTLINQFTIPAIEDGSKQIFFAAKSLMSQD